MTTVYFPAATYFQFSVSSRLVSLQVDPALREELSTNQYTLSNLGIQPGQTVLSINGLLISPSIDIFALLDLLRQESHLMLKLLRLGIPVSSTALMVVFCLLVLFASD